MAFGNQDNYFAVIPFLDLDGAVLKSGDFNCKDFGPKRGCSWTRRRLLWGRAGFAGTRLALAGATVEQACR